jgi:hypothetical protein
MHSTDEPLAPDYDTDHVSVGCSDSSSVWSSDCISDSESDSSGQVLGKRARYDSSSSEDDNTLIATYNKLNATPTKNDDDRIRYTDTTSPVETYYINDDGNGGLTSTTTSNLSEDKRAQLITDNNGLLWDSATYDTSPSGRAHATGPASQSSADPAPAATVFPGLTKGDSREQTGPCPSEIVTTDTTSYLYAYMLKPASAPPRRRRRLFHDKPCDECGNTFELYDAVVGQDPMYCEDCWFGLFE